MQKGWLWFYQSVYFFVVQALSEQIILHIWLCACFEVVLCLYTVYLIYMSHFYIWASYNLSLISHRRVWNLRKCKGS
ncbi:hypothetical protein AB205_0120490 [Aquarana catesbeiana]|uniref:Uncharacterized protein n=1 Tax=Aquarana catesbeiana TaxID=8400 RepID=A0A2G9SFX4_AQUCT|nr:hypothetical protein AB205_0120490 [Aquarana catesbeiana]